MEPHKKVVHAAVGDLRLGSVGAKQPQPVLCGDHIVGVGARLRQVQGTQELLPLLGSQRVDVPPQDRWLLLITAGASPAELAASTIITSKVSWFIKRG